MAAPEPTLGSLLGDEAARRGISHGEAGAHIGVSQATFSRWVAGTSRPTARYWTAIAHFLKVPRRVVLERASKERYARAPRRDDDRLAALESEVAELKRALGEVVARVEGSKPKRRR